MVTHNASLHVFVAILQLHVGFMQLDVAARIHSRLLDSHNFVLTLLILSL